MDVNVLDYHLDITQPGLHAIAKTPPIQNLASQPETPPTPDVADWKHATG